MQTFTEQDPEFANDLPLQVAPTGLADTPFHTLPIRLNHPYMFIHQGNCQHPFVIEEIRYASTCIQTACILNLRISSLRQESDPSASQFPFTTYTPIVLRPKCQICSRASATMSVVGDERLGENPSLVCDGCWEALGQPTGPEQVLAVPLTSGEMG